MRLNAQEPEDLTAYADALPKLVAIGVRPTVQWAHERLGIPVAQDGEPVLGMPAAPSLPVPAVPTGTAATTAVVPTGQAMTRPPSALMQPQLAQNVAPAVAGWIDQVRELVQRAQSLAEIRDGLDALLPGMTLDQYAAAMAEALSAAQLAGRYEVLQEAANA